MRAGAEKRGYGMTLFVGSLQLGLMYGLLAMGFIDLVVESALQPWDIQALIPIVENAGGVGAEALPWQSCQFSAPINLPPLGVVVLKPQRR